MDVLKLNLRSVKKHPEHQIALLCENIIRFGFTQPIEIDENNVIVLGTARYEAARREKLEHLPAIRLAHLTAPQKRALRIADNKVSELGEWTEEILAEEFQFLSDPALDLGFDLQTQAPAGTGRAFSASGQSRERSVQWQITPPNLSFVSAGNGGAPKRCPTNATLKQVLNGYS